MQADNTLPPEERRGYNNVFNAFSRIIKEEGVTSMWKGAMPTVMRAIALNIAMLVSYDQAKEMLSSYQGLAPSSRLLQIEASFVSAFFTSTMSLPFDNIKTKL